MLKSTNFCRLFLILGAILLLIVAAGCAEMQQNGVEPQKNGAEVGKLSMKLSEDMTNENNKDASFIAEAYIQNPVLSGWYNIKVTITDGKIYLCDVLYEESSAIPPAIVYCDAFLGEAARQDKKNGNTEITDTLEKIKNSEPYCQLAAKEKHKVGQILYVYKIDGVYYFVSAPNGEAMRIHYASIQ